MLIDTHPGFLPDNDNWHTDVTFSPTPPMAGILAAKRLPATGGDTLWSSSSAAYETLLGPDAAASSKGSRPALGGQVFPAGALGKRPGVQGALRARGGEAPAGRIIRWCAPIRYSGRKGLFVNEGFTTHINELQPQESQALLAFLFAHAGRPELTVRWQWRVDDVAFWDNRNTQHYAIADYLPERRTMHRATVNGE